jgi:hypothetical protein
MLSFWSLQHDNGLVPAHDQQRPLFSPHPVHPEVQPYLALFPANAPTGVAERRRSK